MLRPEGRRQGTITRPRLREVFRVSRLERSNDRLRTQAALQGGSQGNKYIGLPFFPPSHWLLGFLIDFRSSRNSRHRKTYIWFIQVRSREQGRGRACRVRVEWKVPSTLMCSSVPDFSIHIMFSKFVHVDMFTLIVIHSFFVFSYCTV